MMKKLICIPVILVFLAIAITSVYAEQDRTKDFYKGARMTFIVPHAPGGGYDLWARSLAPYLEKYTGARILVQNMSGAGGSLAGGFLYNNAKPDGLTIGIMPMPGMAIVTLLDFEGVSFELDKFCYIGRVEAMDRILVASKASGFKTIADMQKAKSPIRYGTTDAFAETGVDSSLLAEIFGLNMKIIPGYQGSKAYLLALIAGRELDALSMSMGAFDRYIESGDITAVAVLGEERLSKFPKCPTFLESPIKSHEAKAYADIITNYIKGGRAIVAPPKVPPEKIQFLEKALSAALKEPELMKWANKQGFNINPLSGKESKQLVERILASVPKAERPKLKQVIMKKYY